MIDADEISALKDRIAVLEAQVRELDTTLASMCQVLATYFVKKVTG